MKRPRISTMNKVESADIQRRFEQAMAHDEYLRLRRALSGWREYLTYRRQKTKQKMLSDEHYKKRLLKSILTAWKQYLAQTQHIKQIAAQRYQQYQQHTLRAMLSLWRQNVCLSLRERENEKKSICHYQHTLLSKVWLAWHQRSALKASLHRQQEEALRSAQLHMNKVQMKSAFLKWRLRQSEMKKERLSMEKACRHHCSVLLRKSVKAWITYNHQHKQHEMIKTRCSQMYELRLCSRVFTHWKEELKSKKREAELTEMALWHWSLNLQSKVFWAWKLWVSECQRKQHRLAEAAQVYRDELLREGVTHILTYTTHMSAFSSNMGLLSQEQSSRNLQAVVRRCFLRWKQQALSKPFGAGEMAYDDRSPKAKKSVSFCLAEDHVTAAHSYTQNSARTTLPSGDHSLINTLLKARTSRLQPRRPDYLLQNPAKEQLQSSILIKDNNHQSEQIYSVQRQLAGQQDSDSVPTDPVLVSSSSTSVPLYSRLPLSSGSLLSTSALHPGLIKPIMELRSPVRSTILSSPLYKEELLPPSSFTTYRTKTKHINPGHKDSSLLSPQYFTQPRQPNENMFERDSVDIEDASKAVGLMHVTCDPTKALTKELLEIQLDLQRHQRDRNKLQTWRKLQKVMSTWLQTTGKNEKTEDRESIIQELNELETRISTLSGHLAEQKPTMICHIARISSIENQLLGLK